MRDYDYDYDHGVARAINGDSPPFGGQRDFSSASCVVARSCSSDGATKTPDQINARPKKFHLSVIKVARFELAFLLRPTNIRRIVGCIAGLWTRCIAGEATSMWI
jgi:hypothetical protein